MKFKKIMLIALLLLAVLTIGAAGAADNMDAFAVEDGKNEAVAESPVDSASLESDDYDNLDGTVSSEDFNLTFVTNEVSEESVAGPVLDVGNHTLSVTTIPDLDHYPLTKNVAITVNSADSSVIVPNITFDYGSLGTSTVTGLTDITASVNDEKAVVSVNANVITVSGLDVGSYTLTVNGIDANNENVTKDAQVTVNKLKSSIIFTDSKVEFDYGASGSIGAIVLNGVIGNVSVLNHSEANINVKGTKIHVSGLDVGNYVLAVTTNPAENYAAVTSDVPVIVNKVTTTIDTYDKVSVTYRTSKNIVITLKDGNGASLAGKTVTVKINNKLFPGTTNDRGIVSIAIPKNLAVKSYSTAVSFAGDNNHVSSGKSISVVVTKATPKITAKAKSFKKSVKTKKYTVTLKDNLNNVMKGKKVTIKVNKKTYTAKTNYKGVATFKITKLTKKGKFTATVKYAGDKNYNAKSVKVKITVK